MSQSTQDGKTRFIKPRRVVVPPNSTRAILDVSYKVTVPAALRKIAAAREGAGTAGSPGTNRQGGRNLPPLRPSSSPAALIDDPNAHSATNGAPASTRGPQPDVIPPITPTERIGAYFTPTGLGVRTTKRNANITHQLAVVSHIDCPPVTAATPSRTFAATPLPLPPAFSTSRALAPHLPLDGFDAWELDPLTPPEWVALGADMGGTPAFTRYHVDTKGTVELVPCRVLEWIPERRRFVLELDGGARKEAARLNVLFEAEDRAVWEHRSELAVVLREEAEAFLRLHAYVDGIDDSVVEPPQQRVVERVVARVAAEYRADELVRVKVRLDETFASHRHAVKLAVHAYNTLDHAQRARLAALRIPDVPPVAPPPLRGTVGYGNPNLPDDWAPPFATARNRLMRDLFMAHPQFSPTITRVVSAWTRYKDGNLIDVALGHPSCTIAVPLTPAMFTQHQRAIADAILRPLKESWVPAINGTILHYLDETFDFYIDSLQKYATSRMSRFCILINLILSSQLQELVRRAVSDYTDFVSRFSLTDAERDISLEQRSHTVSGKVPLFVVALTTNGRQVVYEPSLNDVKGAVRGIFHELFSRTSDIGGIGPSLLPLLNLPPVNLNTLSREEPFVEHAFRAIETVLEDNLDAPAQLLALYEEFNYILKTDPAVYVAALAAKDPLLPAYRTAVTQLQRDIERIQERSLNEVTLSFVKVEASAVKQALVAKANAIIAAATAHVQGVIAKNIATISDAFRDVHAKVLIEPETPEELQLQKQYVADCGSIINKLRAEFDEVGEAVAILGHFGVLPDEVTFDAYWETYSWPQKVYRVMDEADYRHKEARSAFQQELRRCVDELTVDMKELGLEVGKYLRYHDEAMTEAYHQQVQQTAARIKVIKEKAALYNSREALFGSPPTQWGPAIAELSHSFQPHQQLWTIAYEYVVNFPVWLDGSFPKLNADEIESAVTGWLRTLKTLQRSLKDEIPSDVVNSIYDRLVSFKAHIPLIHALRNPGLRDRHWKQISNIANQTLTVKQTIKPSDDLQLAHLLRYNVHEHLAEIEEISQYATKEYRLDRLLDKMQNEWKVCQFEVAPSGDTYVLKAVDDIQQLLDDSILKTQTMLSSPYVKAIEANVRQWEAKLLRLLQVLEQWLKVQETWHYLEPIFCSGDIQKSMPVEAHKFSLVNSMWRTTMESTVRNPYVLSRCQEDRILVNFQEANRLLEGILKQLHEFLETKRIAFPRFYFLSNDELLEILSETKDPLLVQPHMSKCFEGVSRLHFEDNLEISLLYSAHGEAIRLPSNVSPAEHNNQVEHWLSEVESKMMTAVRQHILWAAGHYPRSARDKWILAWPGQAVLTVGQVFFTRSVEQAIDEAGVRGLQALDDKLNKQMASLVKIIRTELMPVERLTLEALVVLDVHNRDIVQELIDATVNDIDAFAWQAQMRYYLEAPGKRQAAAAALASDDGPADNAHVYVRQVNASVMYGYEYLGNQTRLVITPLTERCYRTLMGALHLNYGGAPEGPAGTGKTETTKDLGKALAKQCVVYNCSDQVSYREMAKLFKGLASSGAWACFDEFNRIEIQVLSVIAQQISSIQTAISRGLKEFWFEGALTALKPGTAVFITMNPGYAGRAELPDNLKALFRPVAMMVPDYALIAEISLFSFGFLDGRSLARKIVATYKLCSEQLSSQTHYDYGMRAVKSVLNSAGMLKRQYPNENEQRLVLRAVRDINVPKFLAQDLVLFEGIISDLFPDVEVAVPDYTALRPALEAAAAAARLDPTEAFLAKCYQVYEMVLVRHGVMVIGLPFSGKTSAIRCLARALSILSESQLDRKTNVHMINPKSVTMGQLYGRNDATMEWNDGVLSKIFRQTAHDVTHDRQWILLDGPVDAIWIENMNTVLDDNKKLCLLNGDIITMSNSMTMMFEAGDLDHASPATVSRVGLIYMNPASLGWRPLVYNWMFSLPVDFLQSPALVALLLSMFDWIVDDALAVAKKQSAPFHTTPSMTVASLLRLLGAQISAAYFVPDADVVIGKSTGGGGEDDLGTATADDTKKEINPRTADPAAVAHALQGWFVFALLWSVGGPLSDEGRIAIQALVRTHVANVPMPPSQPFRKEWVPLDLAPTADDPDIPAPAGRAAAAAAAPKRAAQPASDFDFAAGGFEPETMLALPDPDEGSLYDFHFNSARHEWSHWAKAVEGYTVPEDAAFNEVIIPTVSTARFSYLLSLLHKHKAPVLFVGETGTGKTSVVRQYALRMSRDKYVPCLLQFSARSSANSTQDLLEAKLEKRRKAAYGPPIGKRLFAFVDDVSLPTVEKYGAQPPLELVRQWLDVSGWYERRRDNVDFKKIEDMDIVCAMLPPGKGRNNVPIRFARHFNVLVMNDFDDSSMSRIYGTLFSWMARRWDARLQDAKGKIVAATLALYETLRSRLLPTPDKPHYTFNLRDVTRVFQGLHMTATEALPDEPALLRVWAHEAERAFCDRLIDDADRTTFRSAVSAAFRTHMKVPIDNVVAPGTQLLFGDFLEVAPEDRKYEHIPSMDVARRSIADYVELYNTSSKTPMNVVVFDYVVEHISRLTRILRQPAGHALCVGMSGSGRRSVAALSAFIADYVIHPLTASRQYTRDQWLDDLRALVRACGVKGVNTVLLLDDAVLAADETFLEDVAALLNSGEVPSLFTSDDTEVIVESIRQVAVESGRGRSLSRDELLVYFVERTRAHLHIILCMSPVGSTFRSRVQRFPSLVNCATIDWFTAWPRDALHHVATDLLAGLEGVPPSLEDAVRNFLVSIHSSAQTAAAEFNATERMHLYVTPTTFLTALGTFKRLLDEKRTSTVALCGRYEKGLEQLLATEGNVETMRGVLEELRPVLEKKKVEAEQLQAVIEKESAEAERARQVVADESVQCNKQLAHANLVKEECEADLSQALPLLDAAIAAVKDIPKSAVAEVRAMQNPNDKVKRVIEAVCVMLDEQPKRVTEGGKTYYDYWEVAKKSVLSDTSKFINRLISFDRENIKDSTIEAVMPYVRDKSFRPAEVKQVSAACVALCMWVLAMEKYYRINKVVKPKKASLALAEAEYESAMTALNTKKAELQVLDDRLNALTSKLDENNVERERLKGEFDTTDLKLKRAQKIMTGLGGEKVRYKEQAAKLTASIDHLLGDVLMSAAVVAYSGPFTLQFRNQLISQWLDRCRALDIPVAPAYDFVTFMGDPIELIQWRLQGLPADSFSASNAIIAKSSARRPLFLDPQGQAVAWIKQREKDNKLVVLRPSETDYHRSVAQCMRMGVPVLLEGMGEDIDPILTPMLLGQTFREPDGTTCVMVGDLVTELSPNFRFYMTTKLPRPHYRPEATAQVTLVNFRITNSGLLDQCLQRVVQHEEKELSDRKAKFVVQGAHNKQRLAEVEVGMLELLSSGANLLEDEEAIVKLESSKRLSEEIALKQADIESVERIVDKTRATFVPVASQAAALFFCLTELNSIDPMYEYSLQWYFDLFQASLRDSQTDTANDERDVRIKDINKHFTYALFTNVCRSLFDKDKLTFAFIIATRLLDVPMAELRWLLTGGLDIRLPPCTATRPTWLPEHAWMIARRLAVQLPAVFGGLIDSLVTQAAEWRPLIEGANSNMHLATFPAPFKSVTSLQRLLILRALRLEDVTAGVSLFVEKALGKPFVEPPPLDLDLVVGNNIPPHVPIIFILASGADPMAQLQHLAAKYGMDKRMDALSLGQGMAKRAEDRISEGRTKGRWIVLQNCHLYGDWMPQLERVIESYTLREDVRDNVHKDYRLWLTALPSPVFPVSVLQNGVKIILEPPRGMRASLLRCLSTAPVSEDSFISSCGKPKEFAKMLFGLCFFHAVVQERRAYGPLGWNIPYSFSEADFTISVRQLHAALDAASADVPFEALTYLTGHCNYGGRVTDDKDRRYLVTALEDIYVPSIFEDRTRLAPDALYTVPRDATLVAMVDAVSALPKDAVPEVVGLHANAAITRRQRDATSLLTGVLAATPKGGSGGDDHKDDPSKAKDPRATDADAKGGAAGSTAAHAPAPAAEASKPPKEIVRGVVDDLLARLPAPFDVAAAEAKYPIDYHQSTNTVLTQEMQRFNKLTARIRSTLNDLRGAIDGLVVMSDLLESCFDALFDGRIPGYWLAASYPTTKPLGAYFGDLLARLAYLQQWFECGAPSVFWLGGFYFTQSFLTGVLQNFARARKHEIDTLGWQARVITDPSVLNTPPQDGCYVNGLFLEGAGWSTTHGALVEAKPKELFVEFPAVWLLPVPLRNQPTHGGAASPGNMYECPIYRTPERRGTLSTTGISTNFVMMISLPAGEMSSRHWIKRSVCLLCQLDYETNPPPQVDLSYARAVAPASPRP